MTLHFQKGATRTEAITLYDKCSLTAPDFLFVFKNNVSGDEVRIVKPHADVVRYENDTRGIFTFTVNDSFLNEPLGRWSYWVYEQNDTGNTDESGLNRVRGGDMFLTPATETETTQYAATETEIKVYNAG
jgi:hypothetical protein